MKRRQQITRTIRDEWIRRWELENERSSHYVSFIKTQDIKSLGSKSRTPDFAEPGQDRDLLSTNERLFFYRLRFMGKFVWIKEQYPLLSLERAIAIAKKLGVRYPTYPYSSNVEVVMTTDFYCRHLSGGMVAYSIKDVEAFNRLSDKQKHNVEIKQQIERVFWESQGVSWHLVMSDSIKTLFARNLEQLFPFFTIAPSLKFLQERWLDRFRVSISKQPNHQLSSHLASVANDVGIQFTESVALFQHCAWHRKIKADLATVKLRFEYTPEELGVMV